MPRAGFKPGSSATTPLEFELWLKPLSHHGQFKCEVILPWKKMRGEIIKYGFTKLCLYIIIFDSMVNKVRTNYDLDLGYIYSLGRSVMVNELISNLRIFLFGLFFHCFIVAWIVFYYLSNARKEKVIIYCFISLTAFSCLLFTQYSNRLTLSLSLSLTHTHKHTI